MKKIITIIGCILVFNSSVALAGQEANRRYINKLLKHNIITQEQINKGVTISGEKGDTKIIKKNGKIYIKRISKEKIKRKKEKELKKKIKENEDNIDELRKEIEKLQRRVK